MATRVWTGASSGSLTTAGNWSGSTLPVSGDTVIFQAGYTNLPSSNLQGLNAAAITGAFAAVIFAEGFGGAIGSSSSYLQMTANRYDFWNTSTMYFDMEASTADPQVFKTATANQGLAGLYLKGSAIDILAVEDGTVGVAMLGGETSTVTEARCRGSNSKLYLGSGVTLTTAYASDKGTIFQRCGSTDSKMRDGTIYSEETGAITTATVYGTGIFYPNSSGTIGTLNIEDADSKVDFTKTTEARTVTDTNWKRGSLIYDPAVVTFTNAPALGLTGRIVNGKLS